jgi:hypothetical protein
LAIGFNSIWNSCFVFGIEILAQIVIIEFDERFPAPPARPS